MSARTMARGRSILLTAAGAAVKNLFRACRRYLSLRIVPGLAQYASEDDLEEEDDAGESEESDEESEPPARKRRRG